MGKFIGLLVAVVVFGGGYLWWQSSQTSAPGGEQATVTTNTNQNPGDPPGGGTATAQPNGSTGGSDVSGGADVGMTSGSTVTVTYNGSGYSPSSVTVKKGQIVRWVNSSSQETWPASAMHPTHSVYPEKTASDCLGSAFDACKGLKQGESWDFTFNVTGEWRYHDHLHTSQTGVVTVEE